MAKGIVPCCKKLAKATKRGEEKMAISLLTLKRACPSPKISRLAKLNEVGVKNPLKDKGGSRLNNFFHRAVEYHTHRSHFFRITDMPSLTGKMTTSTSGLSSTL